MLTIKKYIKNKKKLDNEINNLNKQLEKSVNRNKQVVSKIIKLINK